MCGACVFVWVPVYDWGGGGCRWKSWDRAYELNITLTGRTQSCSHGHACNRLPENRSVEHNTQRNRRTCTHMRTHTHINTQKHAPVSVGRIRAMPVLCRLSATRVQCCHTHLPTEQTRPLDWNNRIKIRAERERDSPLSSPFPPSLTPCPTSPSKCYLTSTPKREKNKKLKKKNLPWR